jgi:hypothetical protein
MAGCLGRVSIDAALAATELECAENASRPPPKVSESNLGYLASHARIAIHIGEFSFTGTTVGGQRAQ